MSEDRTTLGLHFKPDSDFDVLVDRFVPTGAEAFREALAKTIEATYRDSLLMALDERWAPGQFDPSTYKPSDVPALRSIPVSSYLHTQLAAAKLPQDAQKTKLLRDNSFASLALYKSKPYFLPPETVDAAARTDPPPVGIIDELRLPFDALLVVFGTEAPLPKPSTWPEDLDLEYDGLAPLLGVKVPEVLQGWTTNIARAAYDRGGSLTGVVIFSGPNGKGLADEVVWLVSAAPETGRPAPFCFDRQRGLIVGRRSQSLLSSFVDVLATLVDAAQWLPPPPEPPGIGAPWSGRWLRSLTRASARRALERGAGAGVRVIDVRRTLAETRGHVANAAGARSTHTVASHMRRGHFHRYRVAARGTSGRIIGNVHGVRGVDWEYRTLWVPPVFVHPENGPGRPQVWRLPAQRDSNEPA